MPSLTEVVLPEGLDSIGDYSFDGCSSLKTLRIPSTVTTIGTYMCNGCKAITDVYSASTSPFAIADNSFYSAVYTTATLHVPSGTKSKYAALGGWKKFLNISDDLPGGLRGDANGDGEVTVSDVQMVDTWCSTVLLPSTHGLATGIAWIVDDASDASGSPYYNTVGVASDTPQRGVNIKDGRKVVRK